MSAALRSGMKVIRIREPMVLYANDLRLMMMTDVDDTHPDHWE
jgi:hypothetical protein